MLFNSAEFLFVFLPVTLLGFQWCGRSSKTLAIIWLSFMSLVFYGAWRKEFLLLLVGSICFNYGSAWLLAKWKNAEKQQNILLTSAVIINLLALSYFKYLFPTLGFLHDLGLVSNRVASVVLPLGISFFTFTQIAYLIDLKQETAELEPFANYLLFVTFFPHLIAGPILHHSEIMPQIVQRRRFTLNAHDVAAGISLFVIGLFKKVVFADRIAVYVPQAFTSTAHVQLFSAWEGVLAYAMQLYFDFSGYSDMAIGLAYMFSIRFPLNFNSPYKAKSIINFWQRWHMTLTRYLTLYLYNPMALWMARRSAHQGMWTQKHRISISAFLQKVCFPTLTTMFLAGIWHGAGMQFIIFGLLHGFYLSVNHAWRSFGGRIRSFAAPLSTRIPIVFSVFSTLLVFLAVLIGQVFFRADSSGQACQILGGMVGLHGIALPVQVFAHLEHWATPLVHSGFLSPGSSFSSGDAKEIGLLILLLAVVWFCPNSQQIFHSSGMFLSEARTESARRLPFGIPHWKPSLGWAALMAFLFILGLIGLKRASEFLYFQF